MGGLFSKKAGGFEKELEKLEKNITTLESRQKTAQANKRKIIAYLIYIAVFSELVLAALVYFRKKPPALVDRVIVFAPLVAPPLLGYLLSYIITFLYTRRIKSDESKLVKQRSQLKLKLEERKKATEFDTTQQLLSKYEKFTKTEETASPKAPAKKPPAGGPNPNQPAPGPNQQNQNQQGQARPRAPQQPGSPKSQTAPQQPFDRPPAPPGQVGPGVPGVVPMVAKRQPPPLPKQRSWMDKLVDYVVGGEPQHSFALICNNCKAHNGLVPQSEMQSIQFRCRQCNFFNQAQPVPTASSSSPSPPPPPPSTNPDSSKSVKTE